MSSACERPAPPVATLGVNFHKELARLDHHGIKIVWSLAVATQLQANLGAGIRRRQDLGDKLKPLRVEVVARDSGDHHHIRLRLKIPDPCRADACIEDRAEAQFPGGKCAVQKVTEIGPRYC